MGIGTLILIALAGLIDRQQQDVIEYLQEEVRVLRELQGRRRLRFSDDQRLRLARKAKRLGLSRLKEVAAIVSPQTLLAWRRKLIAAKYDSSGYPRRRSGRPPAAEHLQGLVPRMAQENRGWGYGRIQGALANLGHDLDRDTIAGIMKKAGVGPAPERGKGRNWAEFLSVHWEVLGAADFFTVELWCWGRLTRYHVFFVIRLATRRVHMAGIVPEPDGRWRRQVGRNLVDCEDGFLRECRFLIHNRATVFTREFVSILKCAGVESIRLPTRSPNLNAFAERFVRTIKSECLAHLILAGERPLRRAVEEFCAHYHEGRNHQGLENKLIEASFEVCKSEELTCRERLGGLLRYYHRRAITLMITVANRENALELRC